MKNLFKKLHKGSALVVLGWAPGHLKKVGKSKSTANLDKGVVPDRVDVQVVTQAKERSEDPTEEHPWSEVVTQWQSLPKDATVWEKAKLRATAYTKAPMSRLTV